MVEDKKIENTELKTQKQKKNNLMPILVGALALIIIFQGIVLFNIHNQNKQIANQLSQTKPYGAAVAPQPNLAPAAPGQMPTKPHRQVMMARKTNPFMELQRMQQEMDRVMGNFFQHAAVPFHSMNTAEPVDFSPRVAAEQTDDKIIYRFDIPGLEKDKIQAKVQNGMLVIQGERKSETRKEDSIEGFYSNEVSYGSFSRAMPLPPYIDENSVQASYDKGVLTVTFDKIKEKEETVKAIPVS